jgi:hypothetical protein
MQEKSVNNLKKVGVPCEIRYGNLIIQVRVVTAVADLFVKTVDTLTCMMHVINKLIT